MHIERLKVRPRKNPPLNLCGAQLTTMLNCMVATGDLMHTGQCSKAASELFQCMATTPRVGKPHKPTINYHLSRLSKKIK